MLAMAAVALPSGPRHNETGTWAGSAAGRPEPSLRERINQPFQALADRSNRHRRLNGGLTLADHLARADLQLPNSAFVMIPLAFMVGGALLSPLRFGLA